MSSKTGPRTGKGHFTYSYPHSSNKCIESKEKDLEKTNNREKISNNGQVKKINKSIDH
jgi:hypothetical protein